MLFTPVGLFRALVRRLKIRRRLSGSYGIVYRHMVHRKIARGAIEICFGA